MARLTKYGRKESELTVTHTSFLKSFELDYKEQLARETEFEKTQHELSTLERLNKQLELSKAKTDLMTTAEEAMVKYNEGVQA